MDFHAAMETFAEAWVAANTQTAINPADGQQTGKVSSMESLPSLLSKEQLASKQGSSQQPGQSQQSPPSGSGTKSLPIHCVVEQTNGPLTFEPEGAPNTTVELDSYAILPSTTLFSELVRAALVKLGYNSNEAMNAKGAVQIKNWRPLSFDIITQDPKATVEDILGELTQVAKLRIRLCSQAKLSSTNEIKGKLLQLLLTQSQGLLLSSGCPIEKDLLDLISKGENFAHLPPEIRRLFDKWYKEQLSKSQNTDEETLSSNVSTPEKQQNLLLSPGEHSLNHHHPHPGMYVPLHGKTRMRTSFDPEHEIPRLQKWFQENQHPPRELMMRFLDELNSLESRKGRRPLDLTNIIYWFKNARAAHRRASRCFDGESSYDMEDCHDSSPNSSDTGHCLTNKNPVFMLPYPYQGMYGSHEQPSEAKEPCDLSQSASKSRSSPERSEKGGEVNSGEVNSGEDGDEPVFDAEDMEDEEESAGKTSVKQDVSMDKEEVLVKEEVDLGSLESCDSKKSCNGNLPYLPNKNAVYVLPYPFHGPYETQDLSPNQESLISKEPCDLSNSQTVNSSHVKQEKEPLDSSQINDCDDVAKIANEQEKENKGDTDSEINSGKVINGGVKLPKKMHLEENIPSNGARHSDSSGIFNSGSEDEEMESDYDDDHSFAGSESSHEANGMPMKQENHDGDNGYHSSHLSRLQQSASAGLPPLHIPHFPHPLAMHYFPMNTHFLQQTARFQQQQQQQQNQQDRQHHHNHHHKSNMSSAHRKRRTRVFIDPMTEIPKLEKWFAEDTHPSSYMIDKYCEELNRSEYRQKFPKLEAKNVQLWFKNHRAKVKRMRVSSVDLHKVAEFKLERS